MLQQKIHHGSQNYQDDENLSSSRVRSIMLFSSATPQPLRRLFVPTRPLISHSSSGLCGCLPGGTIEKFAGDGRYTRGRSKLLSKRPGTVTISTSSSVIDPDLGLFYGGFLVGTNSPTISVNL